MAETDTKIDLTLKDDERQRLGTDLIEKIRSARSGMKSMLDKMKWLNDLYESNLPPKDFPWEKCSNLNIPVIQSHVDTIHSAANDTLLGVEPTVNCLPPSYDSTPETKAKAQYVEALIEHVLAEVVKFREVADEWNLLAFKEPAGIVKVAWREEYRTVKVRAPKVDEVTGMPAMDNGGRPLTTTQEHQVVKYRGPKFDVVDIANFVIYPLTARTLDEAVIVGDRYRLTKDGILRRIKSGAFDKKACDAFLESPGEESSRTEDTEDREKDEIEGIDRLNFEEYWFWEIIAPYDSNGDGLAEDCVFTIESSTGTIVRATEHPYYHGRRYYAVQRPLIRPRRFFGRCVPELLEGLQREINSIHNQRVDGTTLAQAAAFKVSNSRDTEADAVKLFPGAEIRVDSMDEIEQLPVSPLIPGIDIEELDRDWASRATAVNDMSLGKETTQKKTLGEMQMVQAQSGTRFMTSIRRLHVGVREAVEQVAWLLYQFASDEEIMAWGGGNVQRDDLIIPWQFVPRGTMGAADKAHQAEIAGLLYDKFMGGGGTPPNPLVMQNPLHILRLSQDLLQSADRPDTDAYVGSEEEIKQQVAQAQAMAQAEQKIVETLAAEADAHGGPPMQGPPQGNPAGPMPM